MRRTVATKDSVAGVELTDPQSAFFVFYKEMHKHFERKTQKGRALITQVGVGLTWLKKKAVLTSAVL